MRKRTRRMKRKTGASRLLSALVLAASLACAPGLFQSAAAADKPQAVIAGTIFRDPGFAFPRVELTLTAITLPPGVKKLKPMKTASDIRGEYSFRVPAGSALYKVVASAPGFAAEQREVEIAASERIDVYLTLKPNAR
jgi:hypothetical protein